MFSANTQLWECEGHNAQKLFSVRKVNNCNFNEQSSATWKGSNEWLFFCKQKTDFQWFELFAEKVILELKLHKITSLELLRTPILCLVQLSNYENVRPQMLKSFFLSQKVSKCNFKSKAQLHKKWFFFMKWNVFCNAEDRYSRVWAFLQKKSF